MVKAGEPPHGIVREDLVQAHRDLLAYVAAPGCWLAGDRRIAVAAESRNADACRLCRERRVALSPEHAEGRHARVSDLPDALVELAHRVRSDPRRLSRRWFEGVRASGVEDGTYVEALGIVALLAGLDFFHRAFGSDAPPLPAPLPGEPSGYRPAGVSPGPGWVPTLAPEDATGPESDLYPDTAHVPNIARALSLVPAHARILRTLTRTHYVRLEDLMNPGVGRDLDRTQIELVAARVSALNECFY